MCPGDSVRPSTRFGGAVPCKRTTPQPRNVTLRKRVQNNAYVSGDALVVLVTSKSDVRLQKSSRFDENF
jgi:hypothetical protein